MDRVLFMIQLYFYVFERRKGSSNIKEREKKEKEKNSPMIFKTVRLMKVLYQAVLKTMSYSEVDPDNALNSRNVQNMNSIMQFLSIPKTMVFAELFCLFITSGVYLTSLKPPLYMH